MSRFAKLSLALLRAQALQNSSASRRPRRRGPTDVQAPPDPQPPVEGDEEMILTLDQFLAYVVEWANQNVASMKRLWPLPGGWEAWAQAEIAGYINDVDASTSIQREARVYDNGKRADFLLNPGTTLQPAQQIVVEMKCESLLNRTAYITGLNKDVTKLQNDLSGPYNTCQKLALGIFFSPEAGDALQQLGYTVVITENEIGVAARQC